MTAVSGAFRKLSILVAAYNEEATLRRCLTRVLAAPLPDNLGREVIVVDDGSSDGTWTVPEELAAQFSEVRVFRQPENRGKGAALRRAISEMTGDIAVFQDADLEYDPQDYGRLLRPILAGRADVVYGSRFTGEERKVLYFWHTVGNRFLTLLSNMLNNINLTDMETCYKAFVADRLRSIPLVSNRFGIEPEITAKVARNRLRTYEVPISYNGRTYEEGKKIGWKDGVAALWLIARFRVSSKYADAGKVALDALEQAPRFNKWMYDVIKPYLGERVAELGSGRGNLSKLLKEGRQLLATDYRVDYVNELRERWGEISSVRVSQIDLRESISYEVVRRFRPDTVVCLNVLEHIKDDQAVLNNLRGVLPANARIVFLVPYNSRLTSEFDRQIGHFRRYDRGELDRKMKEAGFTVERQIYFNKVGVFAWWIGNTLMRQRTITTWQLRIYNFLTPIPGARQGAAVQRAVNDCGGAPGCRTGVRGAFRRARCRVTCSVLFENKGLAELAPPKNGSLRHAGTARLPHTGKGIVKVRFFRSHYAALEARSFLKSWPKACRQLRGSKPAICSGCCPFCGGTPALLP